ncbi:hypothetical protein L3Q82_003689 [Scortum barcoo]|uniref:Uncharacterized protein n=1 Tax=Scortum barcoo TaxID=214431 RepID=A0ACB8X7E1_9TELE|nr:hypothetical protein L3Q82_003689 [Scortum barcoo]
MGTHGNPGSVCRQCQCVEFEGVGARALEAVTELGHVAEKVIQDFRKFQLGSRTGRRDIDNAQQASSHCLRYCKYMADGLPGPPADLRFLQADGQPTLIGSTGTWLSTAKKVRRIKSRNQLDSAQELAFLAAAKRRVPRLFHDLHTSRTGTIQNEHATLIGYIMGYLCIISGHRAVKVLTNMLVDHVSAANSWRGGRRFQILVDKHKTVKSFGQASLVLNGREFDWVKRLAKGKC